MGDGLGIYGYVRLDDISDGQTAGQKVKKIKEWSLKIKKKLKRMVEKGDSGYGSKVYFLAFLCVHTCVLCWGLGTIAVSNDF